MAQLNLFKKKQRGEQPPNPKEYELHCMVADTLKRWCSPQWRFTHIPLGEERSFITAGRLKRMGVTRGWPDFIFVGPGRVFFLELKRKGGRGLSDEQAALADHLIRCGCGYLCTDDFRDAIETLKDVGILPRVAIAV